MFSWTYFQKCWRQPTDLLSLLIFVLIPASQKPKKVCQCRAGFSSSLQPTDLYLLKWCYSNKESFVTMHLPFFLWTQLLPLYLLQPCITPKCCSHPLVICFQVSRSLYWFWMSSWVSHPFSASAVMSVRIHTQSEASQNKNYLYS